MAEPNILIPFVKSFEGGFCNIPGDKGGATNKGVTIATYRRVFGQEKTVEDLKAMTDNEWNFIFIRYYWNKWKADDIHTQAIANLLVDWYWMSGSYGIKIPQRILEVTIDGIVGPKTIAAINDYPDQKELFVKLWHERESFFERIARGSNKKFLKGWLRRLGCIKWEGLILNR